MIGYFIFMSLLLVFFILMALSNYHLIFKNNVVGNFFRSKLLKQIIKRIIDCLFTLFVIITLIFIAMKIMPKEYFYGHLSEFDFSIKSPIYNSDDSIFEQLLNYYYNILPFPKKVCSTYYLDEGTLTCSKYDYKIINLGDSYFYIKNTSVWTIIKEKCSVSLLIGVLAYCLQCLIGYPLGFYLAKRKKKAINETIDFLHISITSTPAILYFYLFVLLFMLVFHLPVNFDLNNRLSYIAPLVALCFWGCFHIAYWVNRYVSLEINKDYVKLAIAKGLNSKTIFYKHVMRNALIPLIRTIPTTIALSLSGFYLLEAAFNIPGVGLALVNAINLQDVYVVQGLILFFTFVSLLSYLAGDLITIAMDKKVYLSKEEKSNE